MAGLIERTLAWLSRKPWKPLRAEATNAHASFSLSASSLRNETVRKEEITTDWPDYFLIIEELEFVEGFEGTWERVLTNFLAEYGDYLTLPDPSGRSIRPTAKGLLENLGHPEIVAPLAQKFVYEPDRLDQALNPFRVEELAAALDRELDLCSTAEASRRALAAKAALLAHELLEFLKKDQIFRQQVANGSLSAPFIEAVRTYDASRSDRGRMREAVRRTANKLAGFYGPTSSITDQYRVAAWVSGSPTHNTPGMSAANTYNYRSPRVNFTGATAAKVYLDTTTAIRSREFDLEKSEISARKDWLEWERDSIKHRLVFLRENAELAATFGRSQLDQQRASVVATKGKLNSALMAGGPLNYAAQEREQSMVARRHYRNAAALVIRLHAGLRDVHGLDLPVGPNLLASLGDHGLALPSDENERQGDALLEATLWADRVSRFLLASRLGRYSSTKCISLRRLRPDVWSELSGGMPVKIHLSWRDVGGPGGTPLLLGVGAARVGGPPDALLELEVAIPRQAEVHARGGGTRIIDQSGVHPFVISRLSPIADPGPLEVQVTEPAINCSPVGEWELRLTEARMVGGSIDDIILVLLVEREN